VPSAQLRRSQVGLGLPEEANDKLIRKSSLQVQSPVVGSWALSSVATQIWGTSGRFTTGFHSRFGRIRSVCSMPAFHFYWLWYGPIIASHELERASHLNALDRTCTQG
jgi:hypothetical protein